jgi:hypothetical protein
VDGSKIIVEHSSEDLEIGEFFHLFERFAIAAGYTQNSIDQHLKD